MIPVKDNTPRERFPLATAAVLAVAVAGYAASSDHAGLPAFLLDALFLGLLAPGLESTIGPGRLCVVCSVGAALGLAARALAGADTPAPALFGV
jgi:hypothetical protein